MSLFFVFLGDLFGILLKKEFLAAVSFSCFKPWAHCDVGTLGPAPRKMLLTSQEWRNSAFLWHRLLKKKKKSVIWHKTLLICQQEELGILNFFEDFLYAGKHNHFLWSVCHLRKSWTFKGFTLFSVFSYSFYWISCKTKSNLLFSEH